MTLKQFHKMNKNRQNGLRREYKLRFTDEYKHSIHLFVAYTIAGVFDLVFLAYTIKFKAIIGFVLFVGCFFLVLGLFVLLNRSSKPFLQFLANLDRGI